MNYSWRARLTRAMNRAGPDILLKDNGSYKELTIAATSCNI